MQGLTDSLATLKQQLLADKKKATILGVLILVLLIVVARQFASSPDPALAQSTDLVVPLANVSTPASDKTASAARTAFQAMPQATRPPNHRPIAKPMDQQNPPPSPRSHADDATNARRELPLVVHEKAHASEDATTTTQANQPLVLRRDLFSTPLWSRMPLAIHLGHDQSASGRSRRARQSEASALWEAAMRMMNRYAEAKRQEVLAMERDLQSLQLQSTMTGTRPLACGIL